MMRYCKYVSAGYIEGIGTGAGGTEITEAEYTEIMAVIHAKPAAKETTDFRLREDLTWEEYEVDPPEPAQEIDETEAWDIIFGGAE